MNTFVKIPNLLFYDYKEEKSIYKITSDYKTLLVLDYLYSNTNRRNMIKFTLENMIIECGYKVDCHKGKSFEQFKSILARIIHELIF
jgi:hypothetical protein